MRNLIQRAGVIGALASFSLTASAGAEILPLGYGFDRYTACGTFCYHDSTGTQLIDGQYGVAGWGVDLGNGGPTSGSDGCAAVLSISTSISAPRPG